MRFLGIDPGLQLTGYACLEGVGDRPTIVEAGVIRLVERGTERNRRSISDRLLELERDVVDLIDRTRPDCVAVESLFAHYKHPTTAIAMGHARGVILLTIRRKGLALREYKPTMVKKSLTGHGHAPKAQMQGAVQAWFNLAEPPNPPDVADAIAIALCAARRAGGVAEWAKSV